MGAWEVEGRPQAVVSSPGGPPLDLSTLSSWLCREDESPRLGFRPDPRAIPASAPGCGAHPGCETPSCMLLCVRWASSSHLQPRNKDQRSWSQRSCRMTPSPCRDAQQRHLPPFHASSWLPSQPLPARGQKYPVVQKGRGWGLGAHQVENPCPRPRTLPCQLVPGADMVGEALITRFLLPSRGWNGRTPSPWGCPCRLSPLPASQPPGAGGSLLSPLP